jgi:hypothetical protein
LGDPPQRSVNVSPTALGITLLGVIFSIGVGVGVGIEAAWPVRVGAALATMVLLATVVKVSTRSGHGPLARLADWLVGSPDADAQGDGRAQSADGL